MRKLLIGLSFLALAACGDDHGDHGHGHDHGEEGLDAHACVHVTSGPEASVTATAEASDAPESWEAHHRVDVTLADLGDDTNGGYVKFTPTESGEYRFITTGDVTLVLNSADGTPIAWETTGTPDGCDAAVAAYAADLEGGTTYLLMFAASSETSVGFVAEKQGGHEGHDHEGEHDHDGHDHK